MVFIKENPIYKSPFIDLRSRCFNRLCPHVFGRTMFLQVTVAATRSFWVLSLTKKSPAKARFWWECSEVLGLDPFHRAKIPWRPGVDAKRPDSDACSARPPMMLKIKSLIRAVHASETYARP